jgi:ABC-type phosphate transport system substrate-binding protein
MACGIYALETDIETAAIDVHIRPGSKQRGRGAKSVDNSIWNLPNTLLLSAQVTYSGVGSGTAQCYLLGYSTLESTACSKLTGANTRSPLVDFIGSDSVLSDAQYEAQPDLMMLPACAGGVVNIYNLRK